MGSLSPGKRCLLPTGEDAIRHLFSRGTHRQFGYAAICTMLVVYFLGAAWTAGSAISSGGRQGFRFLSFELCPAADWCSTLY